MWFLPADAPFSAPGMITGSYTSHEGVPSVFTLREEGGQLLGERDGNAFTLTYCGGLRFMAMNPETGNMRYRVEFFIRDGQAWGVRCGTRIFERIS